MTIKSSAAWHAWLRFSDRPHEVQDQEQDLPLAKATARQRCHQRMHGSERAAKFKNLYFTLQHSLSSCRVCSWNE